MKTNKPNKRKISLATRRKIYLCLAVLTPILIGAVADLPGDLRDDLSEAVLTIAVIVLGIGGPGMAAHFSKALPAPETSEEELRGLDAPEELIQLLFTLGEGRPDSGLDRPHRLRDQVKLLKGLLTFGGGSGLLPLLEHFEPVLGPFQDRDHALQLLGRGGPFLRDRDEVDGVTLHRRTSSPRLPP